MTEPGDISFFSMPGMATIFSPQRHVQAMLTFEAALASAEARAGIIPHEAATAIAAACKVELFDVAALYHEAALAGTPAIPLVRMLTARVGGEAQQYVHWGATSQDAIDTALMLQMRDGLDLLIAELLKVCVACAALAENHRQTLMAGRTLLQQAVPITFGLKAARWLALAVRQVKALYEHRARTLAVQLGGAAGTLASLGDQGIQVLHFLAEELKLPAPDLPWHTERDRVATIATTLGIVAGAMEKIACDVILLAQTEVGEVSEGAAPGKGGSSAMPQKRNPVDAVAAIASARLAIGVVPVILSAMAQEHERAAGGWQAEWEAIPNLFRYTAEAIERVRSALANLQVDTARMKANLDLTGGLIMAESLTMALASHMGRPEAQQLVKALCERAVKSGTSLQQVAQADEQVCAILSSKEIDHALDPSKYLGSTDTFIDRALASYSEVKVLQTNWRKKLIQVRKAILKDVDAICRICADGWRNTYQDIYSREYIERTINEFYNPQRVEGEVLHPEGWDGWLVAEQDGVVVGAGGGGMISPGVGEVFVLYVDPQRRGSGIGTALLEAITNQQRKSGAKEQWVSVEAKNDKGLPFYEARGFIRRGERTAYGSKPEENIISLRLYRPI